ncbi:hypothetical protein LX36DRAFT_742163 [Colletotrichum falcatum]|nr:hypothetical protein LX36DRAFT_742163 [Colletotrichum falcatum]
MVLDTVEVRRRAKWVSKEEIERRMEAHVCLRCARKGCWVSKCPLLPPKRPASLTSLPIAPTGVLGEIDPQWIEEDFHQLDQAQNLGKE